MISPFCIAFAVSVSFSAVVIWYLVPAKYVPFSFGYIEFSGSDTFTAADQTCVVVPVYSWSPPVIFILTFQQGAPTLLLPGG